MASRLKTGAMLDDILQQFSHLTKKTEKFLESQEEASSEFCRVSKTLYDFTKSREESFSAPETLPELVIDNLDQEQIWQEIELQNKNFQKLSIEKIASLLTKKTDVSLFEQEFEVIGSNVQNDSTQFDYDDDTEDNDSNFGGKAFEEKSESDQRTRNKAWPIKRHSVVDDKFFKLSHLEDFLNVEDAKESKQRGQDNDSMSEESVDYFDDIKDDENMLDSGDVEEKASGAQMKYDDFFDAVSDEGDGNADSGFALQNESQPEMDEDGYDYEDADDDNPDLRMGEKDNKAKSSDLSKSFNDANKSTFELRQERLRDNIAALEEGNLADKPWQVKGEVSGSSRPENSLLQEHVDFEHTQRQAPIITKDVTQKLEDIIKQRIKDQAWDDVERKIKPVEEPFEYKKRIVLDQEKSKVSLAEIYEQEYLKKQQTEKVEEENPEHKVIQTMMNSLFVKLDALSNFYFTPKMAVPEMKIVNNLPTITVEEVAPVSVSGASLLTPGEILAKPVSETKGKSEKSKTDRLRERRLKKLNQRSKKNQKEKIQKLATKLDKTGNVYNKEKILKKLVTDIENKGGTKKTRKSEMSSSKSVFSRLNELKTASKEKLNKKDKKRNQFKL